MASPFLAPRIVSALTDLPGIFRRIQEALDRVSRSGYVLGLATRDLTPTCPSFQRVSTPAGGVRCVLPRADETNAGQSIILNLESALGDLTIFAAPGQTVNGATTAVYDTAGVIELYSNGVDGWFGLAQLPVGGSGTPTWSQVLGAGANSGAHTPIIDSGQALNFASGATGVTADGDLALSAAGSHKISTGAVLRLEIDSTGAWNLASDPGTSGQFLRSAGAGAAPTWHTFGLLDLPSQAADTFLGNVGTISATPVAVSLSTLAGTGLVFSSHAFSVDGSALAGAGLSSFGAVLFVGAGDGIDVAADTVAVDVSDFAGTGLEDDGSNNLRIAAAAAGDGLTGGAGSALAVGGSTSIIVGANDVQRAALTGEVTASQNSNACTVTRSTNFQASPWTGQHQFNANVYHSGFIGIGAKATVDAYALGDIRSAGDLDILASATGTASLIAGTAIVRNGLSTAMVQCDVDGVRLYAPNSGDLVDIWANNVRIASGLAGTGAGFLRIVESGSSSITLAAGEGMLWVRSDAPNIAMFTDDTNVDHEIAFPIDDDGKDARTWARCVFWDDFCSVQGSTFSVGAFGSVVCDTGWIVTNNAGGTATISQVDGGSGGPSATPGQLQISTGTTTGTQIDLSKGNNNTCRWLRASDVKSLKFRLAIPTTTSVHVTFGLNDSSFGSTDCARFDYDSSVDSTMHVISNSAAGVASNTDINVTPGTAMHSYEIRSPSASSLDWEFYRDGTLRATQTVGSKSRGVNVHISVVNLTASDRTIRVDYCSLETWELSR
jgi:hypothetical protein